MQGTDSKIDRPRLSVVIPCYNEQGGIGPLLERLLAVCKSGVGDSFEVLLVDDGSSDGTWMEIQAHADTSSHVSGVKLARNCGHQLALSAGLQQAAGELIFILDADLQDPPELLPDMLALIDEGNDVVYGQRRKRAGETWFKRKTASLFYRFLSRMTDVDIPNDTGDFRLMTRRVLDQFNAMDEKHRFVRGMISWIGFKQAGLLYDRDERFHGETHYPLGKMISLACDAITSFSVIPLRIATWIGAMVSVMSVIGMGYVFISFLAGQTVEGWASLAVVILFIGGAQMMFLGVIGEYVGRIYLETKGRPLYVVDQVHRGKIAENPVSMMQETLRAGRNG